MASRLRRRAGLLTISATAATSAAIALGAPGRALAAQSPSPNATGKVHAVALHGVPVVKAGVRSPSSPGAAPTYDQCEAAIGVPCYGPAQIRRAYGLNPLIKAAHGGAGMTIGIVDSYGSPTAKADLDQFDADFHLPAPPSFTVVAPLGTVPFDPTDDTQVGWAEETSLDVQWAHALAPRANVVLLTSPVAETQGIQGMPEFLAIEKYAVKHHLVDVITQSWSTTENTLTSTVAGRALLRRFEDFYRSAGRQGVTFLASSGDSGTANPNVAGDTYPFPTVGYPAASPYNTAVGGTSLYASSTGVYDHETVWNDGPGDATGGGVSRYFPEPAYQRSLPGYDQRLLKGHRGLPDVAFNADPNTPVLVNLGFLGDNGGYYLFGGTSEGSPAWAGIVADIDALAGQPVGFLNPALYRLGATGAIRAVSRDITVGNNTTDIRGYSAHRGWDAVTGWGTPDLSLLGRSAAKSLVQR